MQCLGMGHFLQNGGGGGGGIFAITLRNILRTTYKYIYIYVMYIWVFVGIYTAL